MSTTEAPANAPEDPHPFGIPGTGTLDERIARIAGSVAIKADRNMSTGGRTFSYASVDQMAAALAPLLAAEGIAITPIEVLADEKILGRERDGETKYRHLTSMIVRWRVAGGGESFEAASMGKSADPEGSEKDANQAHTFARINLYKSMFHLVTGDDPEVKGSSGGGGGSYTAPPGTGELPNMNDPAGVSGVVSLSDDGQKVGIKHRAEDGGDFAAIKDAARALGARWNGDAKLWELPVAKAETAVILGRHVGLSIASALAERFPVQAQTAPAAEHPPADSLPVGDPLAGGSSYDPDDIPFGPSLI